MFRSRFTKPVAQALARWHERAVGRHALSMLDERILRDIGVDQATAAREAAKPFWRP